MQPAPYFERNGCALYVGDALATLRELPAASVQCCVTSPPYYGLRAYGTNPQVWDGAEGCDHEWGGEGRSGQRLRNGQGSETAKVGFAPVLHPSTGAHCARCGAWRGELGAEPTPDLYVAHLVAVFAQVRRVLRDDGTLWLNIGDSFANDAKWGGSTGGKHVAALHGNTGVGRARTHTGAKPKDLLLIPFRLALALQADGWWVRQTIIWSKLSAMPESVTDRPTTSHEYIFLLSRRATYFYDAQAIAEPLARPDEGQRATPARFGGAIKHAGYGTRRHSGNAYIGTATGTRNARSVWTINPRPFSAADLGVEGVEHFAAYPIDLPLRCLRAGTSDAGACAACGAPFERVTARERRPRGDAFGRKDVGEHDHGQAGRPYLATVATTTTGWRPTCRCADPHPPVPCVALDPFAGAGTTLLAAQQLGRRAVGIELNPDYARIIEARVGRQGVLDFAAEEAAG